MNKQNIFNFEIKSRDEILGIIRDYFEPHLTIAFGENAENPRPRKRACGGCRGCYGVEIVDDHTIYVKEESSIHLLVHECAHWSMKRSLWNPRLSVDFYHWQKKNTLESGHWRGFQNMEEVLAINWSFKLLSHLGIVYEAINYDYISPEEESVYEEMVDLNDRFNAKMNVLGIAHLLKDSIEDEFYLRADNDGCPLYMLKDINEPGIDLYDYINSSSLVESFGKYFYHLVGVTDNEMSYQGPMNYNMAIDNQDSIGKLFRFDKVMLGHYLDFLRQ